MSTHEPAYEMQRPNAVAALAAEERQAFLGRTYAHLFGAMVAFVGLEVAMFRLGFAERIAVALSGNWLIVLGGFVLVSWLASRVAHTAASPVAQYAALGGFVVAEALIFAPLLYIAAMTQPDAITHAAGITLVGFALLTGLVFSTGKDFSFLRTGLKWVGLCALLAIVASLVFSFPLGVWFSVAMVVFAGLAILHDTSNVLHHYPVDRHVGAALELFASVALMFWYVLRIFMNRD